MTNGRAVNSSLPETCSSEALDSCLADPALRSAVIQEISIFTLAGLNLLF